MINKWSDCIVSTNSTHENIYWLVEVQCNKSTISGVFLAMRCTHVAKVVSLVPRVFSFLSCLFLFWRSALCLVAAMCASSFLQGLFEDSVNRCTGADVQLSTLGADLETHLACCQVGKLHPIPAVTEHQRGQSPRALIQSTTGQAHRGRMKTDMTRTLTSKPGKRAVSKRATCLW